MNTAKHHTSPTARPAQLLTTLRDEVRERREFRATRRRLQRELAAYSTRGEVADLMELLRHQESAEADQMRTILHRNLQHPGTNRLAS